MESEHECWTVMCGLICFFGWYYRVIGGLTRRSIVMVSASLFYVCVCMNVYGAEFAFFSLVFLVTCVCI